MLVKLNLKKYSLPKTYVRNGEQCLLDPIRKKLVLKTPEEIVRQKIVCFLQDKMKIPKDKIELEIPMKYYKKRARGRADIIVSAYTENNKFIPVFLVECKAPNVSLTDKVFQQVRKYDEIIYANTVAITNGKYFIIKSWDQETKIYRDLEELPTYKDLVNKKDLVFDKTEYNPWKRPEFKDKYDDCTIKEFIDYQWIGVDTPKKLYPFLINLAGCIQDDTEKLKPQIINGIKIIKDGGIRYTEYGNAGGGRLTGLYRYFIIEDDEGNNQIISMTTMGLPSLKDHPTFGNQRGKTTLIVAIDDYENSHNSLELNLDRYLYKEGNKYTIYHDGAMTVGNRGRVKNKEVIHFIKSKEPCLVKGNKIFLGCFDNNKEIKINQNLTKEFFGNIIKYALLRDEFRKIKKS